MDKLIGSDLEIVLYLNEGYEFGFLNSNFAVKVSMDSNEIVTNAFSPEQFVKFECELVFASNKTNIKRMKVHKVPVRIDFCKIVDGVLQKSFGYIILHLTEAQYLNKDEDSIVKEQMYKVHGLGKEARGSCPQVMLGLRIQSRTENEETPVVEKPKKNVVEKLHNEETEIKPKEEPNEILILNSYELVIDFQHIKWLTTLKNIHLRIHHSKGEVTWPAHEDIQETVPGSQTNLGNLSAKIKFLESPKEFENLLEMVPPQLTIGTIRTGRPCIIGRASLPIPIVNEDSDQVATVKNLLTHEEIAVLTYRAHYENKGEQEMRDMTIFNKNPIADRLNNELEIWKERERERFQLEFEERLQSEISRIELETSKKCEQLEKEYLEKVRICTLLRDELTTIMNQVKEKDIFLEKAKKDIETGFQQLLAETQKETATLKESLMTRLTEKDEIISRLQQDISHLKKKSKNEISIDQVEALLAETKRLYEKLESANKSKAFYKEQWTRTVRELHRLKSDDCDNIQVELKLKKDELEQLGLDKLIMKKATGDTK